MCLLLLVCKGSKAQTCNGSFGDPIVNVTFGSGYNFGPPLPAGTTSSLQYQADICPWDGSYSIVNHTSGCWASDVVWHDAKDHTGNSNGYYMLVNASYQPSNFYIQTVNGLCAGTTYQFAAWILNMCSVTGISPNITFTIEKTDGTVLGSYNTGDIPIVNPVTWTQYGLYFTTPPGVSTVVLRMRNNSPGGVGNDLGLDDITFRAAGASVALSIKDSESDTVNVCEGSTAALQFESSVESCYNNTAYQWQVSTDGGISWSNIPGATANEYTRMPTGSGKFLYRLTVAENININVPTCRVSSNPVLVSVNALPNIALKNNSPVCSGETVALTASGGDIYQWSGPNGYAATGADIIINDAAAANSGRYYLTAFTNTGCKKIDSTIVFVYDTPLADFRAATPGCEKAAISFEDQSAGYGESLLKWNWDFGDGAISTEANPVHIFKNAGSYQVSLLVENSRGCKSAVKAKMITVHPMPLPDFTLPGICLADPFATFINTSSIDGPGNTINAYKWDFGDTNASAAGNTSSLKSPQHSYSSVGIYPVHLTVTSNNGCVNDTIKNFTVNGASPVAKFSFDPLTSFCSNTAIIVENRSTVNFGNITRVEIYWDYANDPSQKLVDSFPSAGEKYTHQYETFGSPLSKLMLVRYVVYSGINCVNENTQAIYIKASPGVSFSSLNSICETVPPFALTQAAEINGLPGTGVYTGDGVSGGLFNPKAAGAGDHTIRYTFTGSNNCIATAEQPIKVFKQPAVNAGPDRTIILGDFITLNASATGYSLLFEWTPSNYIDNNLVLTPAVSPLQNTLYTVRAISSDGCEAKDEVLVTVVKDIFVPNAFSPNGDGINDAWRIPFLDSNKGISVQVFNRYGQVVYESKGQPVLWDGTFKGQPVQTGTYVWMLNPGTGKKIKRGTVTVTR